MAQLRRFADEFRKRDTQILLISFGTESWARAFAEETQAPFPLLLDPELNAYRAYGLRRSMLRTFAPATVWHYLKAMLQGRKVNLKSRGDPAQLGGDFLADRGGRLIWSHRSAQPADRPKIQQLLDRLDSEKG